VQVGHHHGPDFGRVDAQAAQLAGHGVLGLHPDVLEQQAAEPPHALLGIHRDGGVEAGVDEDLPGGGVFREERDHGHLGPLVARHAHAHRLQPREPPLLPVKKGRRRDHPRAQQGVELHHRAVGAPRKRERGRARLGGGGHGGEA
jgi:hypothetical protein